MASAIEAAKHRATVGEISMAMEKVFGRHQAVSQSISGVYRKEYEGDEDFMNVEDKVNEFEKSHGRRPRILVFQPIDGHDQCESDCYSLCRYGV